MAVVTQSLSSVVKMSSFNPTASSVILEASATRLSYLTTDNHVVTLIGSGFTYGADAGDGPTGGTVTRFEVTPSGTSGSGAFAIDKTVSAGSLPGGFFTDDDVFWDTLLSGNDTFNLAGAASQPGSIFNGSIVAGDGNRFPGLVGEGGDDTMLLFDAAGDFYGDLVSIGVNSGADSYTGGDDVITGQAGAQFQNVVGDVANVFGDVLFGGIDTISVASTGAVYGDVYRMLYGGLLIGGADEITIAGNGVYRVYGDAYEVDDFGEPLTFTGGNDTIDAGASSGALALFGDVKSTILGTGNGQPGPQIRMGDDTITGGQAADTIYGDLEYLSTSVTVRFGADDVSGGAGDDTIYGDVASLSSSSNQLLLSGGNDVLDGDAGNDTIYGQFGIDTLRGGAGNDMLDGGLGGDSLDGGAGIDTASYGNAAAGVTLYLLSGGTAGEAAGDTFTSIENVEGSGWGDVIVGSNIANVIDGGVGADFLYGLFGADTLRGGAGNDLLLGGVGADVLDGGVGSDVASYAAASSGVTLDLALGGGGTRGEALGDTFVSVDGVIGSGFADQIYGFAGVNVLFGGGGNDFIDARSGNDIVRGDAGDDRINGGAGNDRMAGGAGSDTFVFTAGHGRDRIDDWQNGSDRLDYRYHSGVDGLGDLEIRNFGSSAVIEDGSGGVLVVVGGAGEIDASDFLF